MSELDNHGIHVRFSGGSQASQRPLPEPTLPDPTWRPSPLGPHERHLGRGDDEDILVNVMVGMFVIAFGACAIAVIVNAGWWSLAVPGFFVASWLIGAIVRRVFR